MAVATTESSSIGSRGRSQLQSVVWLWPGPGGSLRGARGSGRRQISAASSSTAAMSTR